MGEGFGIVLGAIERHGNADAKLPVAPPYFRFADPKEVRAMLEPIGFKGVSTAVASQIWHHSSPNELFDAFNKGALRATAMLNSQPENARTRIKEAVCGEVCELARGSGFLVPVPASISVGFKNN